jgi:hypothetical protein
MPRERARFGRRAAILGATLAVASLVFAETPWFVSFDRVAVSPVKRSETSLLFDAGSIEAEGFKELVVSLGGEFKPDVPSSGRVGVILIPDSEGALYLFRSEGKMAFPVEVTYNVKPGSPAFFVTEPQVVRVAFPKYRVFLYNETPSTAMVSVYVYRTRC